MAKYIKAEDALAMSIATALVGLFVGIAFGCGLQMDYKAEIDARYSPSVYAEARSADFDRAYLLNH